MGNVPGMRKLITLGRRRPPAEPPRVVERDSGEEEVETREAREAEATPSHMTRLKTNRL
jgi:hypothetical protein